MGRRRGGDKIHNKKIAHQKTIDREIDTKEKIPDIIIGCEDSVSSPTYFRKIIDILIKNKKITQDSFVVPHKNTDPKGVLKNLINYTGKNNKTYKDFDHKWIVIDRDEQMPNQGGHTPQNFNDALKDAKSQNIEVAYSNDSFELWYLLHFHYITTSISRNDIAMKVIPLLTELDSSKLKGLNSNTIKQEVYVKIIFDLLLEKQQHAIKNAKRLLKHYGTNHNPEKDNPSTTVHLLVEVLNKIQKY